MAVHFTDHGEVSEGTGDSHSASKGLGIAALALALGAPGLLAASAALLRSRR